MAKPPYFPFYYQDFLTGTRFFTNAQTGAYIRLLLDQWDLGVLKDKHFIARMNGISQEECKEIRVKFKPVCVRNEDGFQNEKMEKVRKYVAKIGKIRSESGKLGGVAKAKQTASKTPGKQPGKSVANQGIQISNPNPNTNPDIKSKIKDSLSSGKKNKNKPPLFPWPEEFQLTIHLSDYAMKQGHHKPEETFEDFRMAAVTKSYMYADWNLAFMRWCRDQRTKEKSQKLKSDEENYGWSTQEDNE